MSYNASFYAGKIRVVLAIQQQDVFTKGELTSKQHVISVFSTKLCADKSALYGSTTVSETFGLGKIAKSQSIPIMSPSVQTRTTRTKGAVLTIRVLLSNLAQQQGTQSTTRSSAQTVQHLEPLQAIRSFRLASRDIQDRVDKFRAFGIVSFCPVVSSTTLGLCTGCKRGTGISGEGNVR
jgi:hypothetical protein